MENCKVVFFTEEISESLRRYMQKIFPHKSDVYLSYCIEHAAGRVPSLVVVKGDGEIVGCHLYYCTKALLNGEEIDTQWGHDTYLDKEYRKEIGVDFLLARKKIPAFGVGLTETNAKMRKLMKSVFLDGVFNYYTITPALLLSPFQKLLQSKPLIKNVESIKGNGALFTRVRAASQIVIPNDGYWYKGYYDLDFVRDTSFLENRFFRCKVHDYKVFASNDSYFVVRESSYRGLPALMLSDFRYSISNPDSVDSIMKAVMKLARKSHFGIVFFVCGDKRVESFFKRRIHFKTHLEFISSYKISPNTTFSLTGGDSDAEFLKA